MDRSFHRVGSSLASIFIALTVASLIFLSLPQTLHADQGTPDRIEQSQQQSVPAQNPFFRPFTIGVQTLLGGMVGGGLYYLVLTAIDETSILERIFLGFLLMPIPSVATGLTVGVVGSGMGYPRSGFKGGYVGALAGAAIWMAVTDRFERFDLFGAEAVLPFTLSTLAFSLLGFHLGTLRSAPQESTDQSLSPLNGAHQFNGPSLQWFTRF